MKKQSHWSAAICVALAVAVVCSRCSSSAEPANAEPEEAEVVSVEVMPAKLGEIQSEFLYSGKVKPVEEANVVSTVGNGPGGLLSSGGPCGQGRNPVQVGTEDIENNLEVLNAQLAAAGQREIRADQFRTGQWRNDAVTNSVCESWPRTGRNRL